MVMRFVCASSAKYSTIKSKLCDARNILRKEVIQPQVPLRLPCYDFTPVAELTVVRCPLERLAHGLRVNPTPMV